MRAGIAASQSPSGSVNHASIADDEGHQADYGILRSNGFFGEGVIGSTTEARNGYVVLVDLKVVDVSFSAIGTSCIFGAQVVVHWFPVFVGRSSRTGFGQLNCSAKSAILAAEVRRGWREPQWQVKMQLRFSPFVCARQQFC